MATAETKLLWEPKAFARYSQMIEKIPLFHRQIAKTVVDKKAQTNALQRGSDTVEEGDILRAFFSEVPITFYSLMVRLMDEVGFHYKEHELQ